jgi:hypothetical protein
MEWRSVNVDPETGATYVEGSLYVTKHPDGWYVEYSTGTELHRVGPTTRTKAKQIARTARESVDGKSH